MKNLHKLRFQINEVTVIDEMHLNKRNCSQVIGRIIICWEIRRANMKLPKIIVLLQGNQIE